MRLGWWTGIVGNTFAIFTRSLYYSFMSCLTAGTVLPILVNRFTPLSA